VRVALASFPDLLHLQFLIAYSMQKQREKAWGILSHALPHNCQATLITAKKIAA